MDWRLFFSTFALIFFAELGDKTQLAAMASAAGNKSTWSVFAGASSALVFSTLVAVMVGSVLNKLAPDYLIKAVAGGLFLIFGALLIWSAMRGREAAAEGAGQPGLLSWVVLEAAKQFEAAAVDDYVKLADSVENPELKSLFLTLAEEERRHLDQIHTMAKRHGGEQKPGEKPREIPRFLWAGGELLDREMEILAGAIQQEKAKVEFYEGLGQSAPLAGVRSAFQSLAEEEKDHVRRLQNAGSA
ncbi:TMEM165/GDT1 family protein [bacterium]|nr:TMEM165/GDT1 family protein [bacterium]